MLNLQKLIRAYEASDSRGRTAILDFATEMAEDWPGGPSDILVAASDPVRLPGGEFDNFEPSSVVGPSKEVK